VKPRPRKALLDTNLLLLWLVAQTDPKLLDSFKRVNTFTPPDIDLLRKLLRDLPEQITTPHVLSETSNFVRQASPPFRNALSEQLGLFIMGVDEIYKPAASLIEREEFIALGLTDTGIADVSERAVVITTDYKLSGKITAGGGNAINFNQQRSNKLLEKTPDTF
jgi:hypothetical protein